jgi:hypothetical protein
MMTTALRPAPLRHATHRNATHRNATQRNERMMSGETVVKQSWFVYVKLDAGRRETIRTTTPDELPHDRCVVLAKLPEARKTVLPGKVRKP